MSFSPAEAAACQHLVDLALEEDLGPEQDQFQHRAGDRTSRAIIPAKLSGRAVFLTRAAGVVAGIPAVEMVFKTINAPLVVLEPLVEDGARVKPGDRLAVVGGLMEFILTGERTALNFLQHLSGVASRTRRYVDAVAGLPCQILDTRKTTPGWRLLEKYAVRCGGGVNHRVGLYDAILVKDNHLAALGGGREAFASLPRCLTAVIDLNIEIEVDNLDQLDWAIDCAPNFILLDNMNLDQLREAVRRRNQKASKVLLEASGGVNLETVRAIAETGVDRISVGELTHSAPALDIGLDFEG
jgi:nicotinate-nucleotide pyrophosphorylase (carboxylating)